MDQTPIAGRPAAATAHAGPQTSLTRAALLCVLTYALAAGLTLALCIVLSRLAIRRPASEPQIALVFAAGMASAALLAVLVWIAAASRALGAASRAEIRRGDARIASILRASMEAIITIDDAQDIVFFNPAAERIFGVTAAEAIGTPLARFVPQRFRTVHAAHIARFGVTGASEARMGGQRVLPGLRANGEEFPLEASISRIQDDAGGQLYTVVLRDVTQRIDAQEALRQSREELRELSANLQNLRETEKRQIARELHDDLGQQLAALKMDLDTLGQTLCGGDAASFANGEEIAERLRRMRRLIDSAVASLRRIAADLRPVMLDDLGLVAAIEWLANDFTDRYGIEIVRRIEPDNAVYSRQGATALFRIIQEALNNVARHADATAVELTLSTSGPRCLLRIADNGRGAAHDAPANGRNKAFGLIGVRERAHMLGGTVHIDTAHRAGFAITVTFPLQSLQQEEIDS